MNMMDWALRDHIGQSDREALRKRKCRASALKASPSVPSLSCSDSHVGPHHKKNERLMLNAVVEGVPAEDQKSQAPVLHRVEQV